MAEDQSPQYPTVPEGELSELFSYKADVNLESPALREWYDSIKPKVFKNLFGRLYGESPTLSEEQRERIREVAKELAGQEVEVEFTSNDSIIGEVRVTDIDSMIEQAEFTSVEDVISDLENYKIIINENLGFSSAFPDMVQEFRPKIPSGLTQEMMMLSVIIHEVEHLLQKKEIKQRDESTGISDEGSFVDKENDSDYPAIKFLREQNPSIERSYGRGRPRISMTGIDGDKIADALLDFRAYNGFFQNVAISNISGVNLNLKHITSLSIRHYERTGEILDQDAVLETHKSLTGKISDFIDNNELGVWGHNAYERNMHQQYARQGIAYFKEIILELDQEERDALAEGLKEQLDSDTLDEALEKMLFNEYSNSLFKYVNASIYNPVLMLTALEDVVAHEDLTEMESYMAANAMESLRGLGYKPIEEDLSEHVDFVIEAMDSEIATIFKRARRDIKEGLQELAEELLEQEQPEEPATVTPDDQPDLSDNTSQSRVNPSIGSLPS